MRLTLTFNSDKPKLQSIFSDREQIIEAGTPLQLEVQSTGDPTPTIEWRQDGATIKCDDNVEIHTTNARSVLTIQKASVYHSGIYTVRAENRGGIDLLDIPVIVTGKCMFLE